MRVILPCEFSGRVRRAFRARGHDAWSCDLLPCEDGSPFHYQFDVRELFEGPVHQSFVLEGKELHWDLMIAFPPCTRLAVSGARWFRGKEREQAEAIEFVRKLMAVPVPRICIENPVGVLSTAIRKPDQIIQPWQFGHGETKATCLWLKELPLLIPTKIVEGRAARVHREPPSPQRWKNRSRTYQGIADAMAEQWGRIT